MIECNRICIGRREWSVTDYLAGQENEDYS